MQEASTYATELSSLLTRYCAEHFRFAFDPAAPRVRLHEPSFGAEEITAMTLQALTTQVTMGVEVKKFEQACAKRFSQPYAVMSNSGSSANLLAVAALCDPSIASYWRLGDEVIVPALSWATTVWPLLQYGLVPVFVDCDIKTYNASAAQIEAAITPKTRGIMLVHVYGNPCDMEAIMSLASKHNLYVIEDCCEAMGARFQGREVGSFGDIGTMSLYFSHHITTFEGGLSVTGRRELSEIMRVMRAHGWSREAEDKKLHEERYPEIDPRFIFINTGYNLRPTEVQAAMGQIQLDKLEAIIAARRQAHAALKQALSPYQRFLQFQQEQAGGEASWFGFGIVLAPEAPFSVRDITGHLQARHIETRPIIAGNMARHPAMQRYHYRSADVLTHADHMMRRGFAIACHPYVCAQAITYIAECFAEFFECITKK